MELRNRLTKAGYLVLVLFLFCLGQMFAASCGDVDSSGDINIVDALRTAQYSVGLDPANFDPAVADVDANGVINIVDALRIAQYYVGLVTELSCSSSGQDPIFSGGPYTLDDSNYVDLPDGLTNNLGDFSIACWVHLNSLDNWSRIFDFGGDTNVFMMLTPASGSTGYPYFTITVSGNSGEQGINGTSALPTGSWQHLAVVLNGDTGILYINRQEVGRNTGITLNPSDLGETMNNYIGRSQWSNDPYLNASIDKFFVFDRALSASEVSSLGSNPPPAITPTPTPIATPTPTPGPTGTKWVGTWANAVYQVESSNMPPMGLANNTLRQIVRVSIGGSQIRLKFSNRLGNSSLVLNSVHLARSTGGSSINTGTDITVKFGGSESVTIPAGNTVTSDTFAYNLPAITNMAITIYFGSVPSVLSGHPGSRTTSYIKSGNAVASSSLSSASTTDHWYIIEGIDVLTENSARAVIGYGDSITDGRGTTTNAQNRWTDVLATRLQNNSATADKVGVLNEGIGGTLASGSGVNRFDIDVLGQSGKRYLIVLYGINDIIFAGASSSTVINAYKTYITKAHANNMLAYGGTLLPFGGYSDYTAAREQIRQEVNNWIRSTSAASGGFDAVVDFDAALRDPNTTNRLLRTYDSGDHLHPGPAGYQKMGETINLNLLAQ